MLPESARSGDRLKALEDLRNLLADTITATDSARDVAALSARLTDVLTQIAEVKAGQPQKKGTALDEVNERRAARQAKAAGR